MPNVAPTEGSKPAKTTTKKTAPAKTTAARSSGASRSSGARTSSGATVAAVISRVASSYGIPPEVALALGLYESGLDPNRIGDQGSSFGIYQLHQGGELGNHDANWAYNVENNARTALAVVANVRAQHPDWDWGTVVAAAQRPADQASEAAAVNSMVADYQQSGKPVTRYFTQRSQGEAGTTVYAGGVNSGQMGQSTPLTVKQYLDDGQIQQNYGYLVAYLHDPEIGPILAKAAKQGWGPNELLGALSKTQWWQKTSASARAWQAQQRVDPATANQRLNQMVGQVQQLAKSTLGYALDPDRASRIANTALGSNWSQQQLQHAVGAEFHFHQARQAMRGAAANTINQFKQMADAYLVPLSNHTIANWTRGVLQGTYQPQDFQAYLQRQALSLYPTLKEPLKAGQTVKDYLNPYAQLAGQTLEINPDSINWMHPKWAKALNTTTPDGDRAPMSLSDWGTYLRSLPEYKQTQGAQDQAAHFALNLAQTFGRVSI